MAKKKKGRRKWIIGGLVAIIGLIALSAYFRNASQPKGVEIEKGEADIRTIRESVSASPFSISTPLG